MLLAFILLQYAAFLISLSVHEFCHALVSHWLGDSTARRLGRLTLNPLVHMDMIGTVVLPLIGLFSGWPVFGWAKPVPTNPYNLKYHKWGMSIVALAGPISNLLGATLSLIFLKVVMDILGLPANNFLVIFLKLLVMVNIVLGLFNMLPIPPLDGSRLLETLLDAPKYRHILVFLERQGTMILFMLIIADSFLPSPLIGRMFNAAVDAFFGLAGISGI